VCGCACLQSQHSRGRRIVSLSPPWLICFKTIEQNKRKLEDTNMMLCQYGDLYVRYNRLTKYTVYYLIYYYSFFYFLLYRYNITYVEKLTLLYITQSYKEAIVLKYVKVKDWWFSIMKIIISRIVKKTARLLMVFYSLMLFRSEVIFQTFESIQE
jgi:hypothetical protein